MTIRIGRRGLVGLAVLVVLVVGVGIGYAAIPSGGVYTACLYKNLGTIRLIDPSLPHSSLMSRCLSDETQLTWSQTGPQGLPGKDGVSITSSPVAAGDVNCPLGGSKFVGVGGVVTYACNGPKGDKGDQGEVGPAGSTTAYTNYGDGSHHLDTGTTQTVASLTLPAGTYTLSATASVARTDSDDTHAQCSLVSAGTLNANVALGSLEGVVAVRMPLIGDVTIANDNTSVFLRCVALDGPVTAGGDLIATRVGAITPSS